MRALLVAAARVGLTPSGHNFGLLIARGAECSAAVAALEAAIEEHTPAAALQRGLRCRACVDGLLVAGVPIGTPAFQTAYAQSVLNAHEAAHAQLREMGDAQAMYLLLRYCLSARLTYLLRALSPAVMAPVAAASDATTVYALRRYLIR